VAGLAKTSSAAAVSASRRVILMRPSCLPKAVTK
jgi:hypothetical protein